MSEEKFPLGKIVATPGAIEDMEASGMGATDLHTRGLLTRHMNGDWGDICEEDRVQNEWALENGERLMSVYALGPDAGNKKLWVITERDRSVTTILRPEDY